MKIFPAGAAGTIGRRLVPLLLRAGHYVVGTTRSTSKADVLRDAGVEPIVIDIFDTALLTGAVSATRPDIVIHQLTDLPPGLDPGQMAEGTKRNARMRRVGTQSLVSATLASGVRRLIAQSIAGMYAPGPQPHAEDDPLDVDATGPRATTADGVATLERLTVASPPIEGESAPESGVPISKVGFDINGARQELELDPRTTLLDALREHLRLTGTKKGCDHGQCGACTVIVNGRRINSCLSLAVMHEGDQVTTIEGLGPPDRLHPMQAAFIKHDGFQCGFCTPGQICSAVAMLDEVRTGIPSHVSASLIEAPQPTDLEVRERMSGNICRCGAYSNIHEAIAEVAGRMA